MSWLHSQYNFPTAMMANYVKWNHAAAIADAGSLLCVYCISLSRLNRKRKQRFYYIIWNINIPPPPKSKCLSIWCTETHLNAHTYNFAPPRERVRASHVQSTPALHGLSKHWKWHDTTHEHLFTRMKFAREICDSTISSNNVFKHTYTRSHNLLIKITFWCGFRCAVWQAVST